MNVCFLCEKNDVEMSLEHSIPQFLGGKKSDDKFKKLNLCKSCNSQLGTHVDGRFARSPLVSMQLNEFNDDIFLGHFTSINFEKDDNIHNLIPENYYVEMMSNDKCNAFWIKANTDNFLGLTGGHPPLSKSQNSQIFLFITKKLCIQEIKKLLNDIRIGFKKYKKLEILLCIDFIDESITTQDDLILYHQEIKKIFNIDKLKFIWEFTEQEKAIQQRLSSFSNSLGFQMSMEINLNDYVRFLSKLYLGILCGYLGKEFTEHPVGLQLKELVKTYLSKENIPEQDMQERFRIITDKEKNKSFLSEDNAIIIAIFQIEEDIIGYLSINNIVFSLKICSKQNLSKEERSMLKIHSENCNIPEGVMLILNKNSEKYIEKNVKEFIQEKCVSKLFPILPDEQKAEIFTMLNNIR